MAPPGASTRSALTRLRCACTVCVASRWHQTQKRTLRSDNHGGGAGSRTRGDGQAIRMPSSDLHSLRGAQWSPVEPPLLGCGIRGINTGGLRAPYPVVSMLPMGKWLPVLILLSACGSAPMGSEGEDAGPVVPMAEAKRAEASHLCWRLQECRTMRQAGYSSLGDCTDGLSYCPPGECDAQMTLSDMQRCLGDIDREPCDFLSSGGSPSFPASCK